MSPREHDTQDRVIHEVDGIQEYDNRLPNWWLYTLYATVFFSVGYWYHYHVAAFGDSQQAAYQGEMDRAAAAQAERFKTSGAKTPEALAALAKDRATVEQGKLVFEQNCVACHRQDGGGSVGPNLTDEFWLHGSAPDRIYKSVNEGWSQKGMPAWGPALGDTRVTAVSAYVISLRGTNVANGKPPQGEPEPLSLR